jgi:bZIP transcription factor/Minimal binding motif of Hap4 for binding to Hap2/3/5
MAAEAASPATAASPRTPIDVKPNIIPRPSLVMKPAQTPPAASPPPNSATGAISLTSKEWFIPPRPKPGRKPATDTPPSKRKAQNRAAQRAFRERRAARVNELEDQIKVIDDENEREQDALKVRVSQLEQEVERYRTDLVNWVDRCRNLENELTNLKSSRVGSKTSADSASHDVPDSNDTSVGCGKCTLETRCQCIDDAFDAMSGEPVQLVSQSDKRPHSPYPGKGKKRVKTEPGETLEIDFTAMYSKSQPAARAEQVSPTSAVADPCGFCSDGTPCICAEMAAEQERADSTKLSRTMPLR